MIYDTIAKGDDGLYHVHAFTDEHKRCFIRLDNVVITDATDDITFDINASTAIDEIHEGNIQNAIENGESWFGKKVSEKTIRSAYIRDEALTAECIEQTKEYTHYVNSYGLAFYDHQWNVYSTYLFELFNR